VRPKRHSGDETALRRHGSSDRVERGFCETCEPRRLSRLASASAAAAAAAAAGYDIAVGALDDRTGLTPTDKTFTDRNPEAHAAAGPQTSRPKPKAPRNSRTTLRTTLQPTPRPLRAENLTAKARKGRKITHCDRAASGASTTNRHDKEG
jgi:hypothetical protein